jgi:O-antigen/teichoic acid export membrane protein
MGYGVVLSRYTLFAISGLSTFKEFEGGKLTKNKTFNKINSNVIFSIIKISNILYKRLSIIAFIILLFISPYMFFITKNTFALIYFIPLWIIFTISVLIRMFSLSNSTIIKGLGKVRELNLITIIESIFNFSIKILMLSFGLGIYALTISLLIDSIIIFLSYLFIFNKFVKNFIKNNIKINSFYLKLRKSVYKKTNGIAVVIFSNFIQNQLFFLLAPIFISLDLLGKYSFSWNLVSMIASISTIGYNTYRIKLANYNTTNKTINYKNSLIFIFITFLFTFLIGNLFLFVLIDPFLTFINSNIQIIPLPALILMAAYSFAMTLVNKSTDLLSLENDQRYVLSITISSILVIILSSLLLFFGLNVYSLPLTGLIILLSYSFWKWPKEILKKHPISISYIVHYFQLIINSFMVKLNKGKNYK